MFCPINEFTKAMELFEDRVGGGSPEEGPFAEVVVSDILVDLVHQFAHALERTAPDGLLGDQCEPALELTRINASKTLAFGKRIHYCLGAALGKLEAHLALEALTRHFPRLRLVEDQVFEFRPNLSFRGPEALWVRPHLYSDSSG